MSVTAVLSILIAVLTLLPPSGPAGLPGSDKLYHFVAFAALIMPISLLYPRALIWMLPAAILFAGAIEVIQPNVGRAGEWGDFLADTYGVVIGATLGLALRFSLKRWLSLNWNRHRVSS